MSKAEEFYEKIISILGKINETQQEKIQQAAEMVADQIAAGRIVYILGSGHSLMVASEAYHRAGGLAPIDIIHDRSFGRAERCLGYAKQLLDWYDPPSGSLVFIISQSGRNALGIEMALECKARGISTIAITCLAHSQSVTARHPSGKRLFEVADLVIDNCGVPGDAVLEIEGLPGKFTPTSTIAGSFIMDAIMAQAIENLVRRGIEPPVFVSANVEGGDEHNKKVFAKYQRFIKGL